ncbi:MAG: hypothetical protein KTR35_20130 [Gammaproteobacteria bacterium]|nr:hypothetical protein [Gammaproteobacteria bacterium]
MNISNGLLLLAVAIVCGCQSEQIPADAQLSVTPSIRSFEVTSTHTSGDCDYQENVFQDVPLLYALSTSEGAPIGGATLSIIADFTEQTFSGLPVLALYDDFNGNGVVDADTELVSGGTDVGFTTRTSRYNGDRLIWVRVNLSCAFSAEIFAYSGTASATASISVAVHEPGEIQPEAPPEPVSPEPVEPEIQPSNDPPILPVALSIFP